jgi:guanylate kinase
MHNMIVISGPSGSGKSTLIIRLLNEFPKICFSVSHTTRPPRPNEIPGRDYHFIAEPEFHEMIQKDEFAEWAEVHGHRYGTSWREIRAKSSKGRHLILDIDVQGACSIKRQFPEAMAVFIVPPSLAELKKRLRRRKTGLNEETRRRLRTALSELRAVGLFDYLLINDDLETAAAELRCLYRAFCRQMGRNKAEINKILRGQT